MSEGPHGLLTTSIIFISIAPCTIALSSFSWPFLVLWLLGGWMRWYFGDRDVLKDFVILGITSTLMLRESLVGIWKELDLSDVVTRTSFPTMALGVTVPLVLLGMSYFYRIRKQRPQCTGSISENLAEFDLKAPTSLIFPCQTTHARMFPKRHAFGYSYLLYGIPIAPAGTKPDGTAVTTGKYVSNRPWWMRVRAEDYLERGYGELGFYGKLRMTLREQGVPDSEWSYAYLVTAPRFFGYSFNPVSFWYIYDRTHELKRMILEVNNTFGERRIYVLDGSCPGSPARGPVSELPQSNTKNPKFTDVWLKDFHVSPFNSRKGSYALKALNPFPSPGFPDARIDNTITLKSSKDHVKIVARVHSTGPPMDANNLGPLATIRFIGGWWWVGFVTFPRILREAFKLYFHRSLHVWFRPEILSTSIGCEPSSTEIALQKVFRDYLQHLVWHSPEQWIITYHTAIPDRPKEMIMSTYVQGRNIVPSRLELRVLTPVFYSRFIHYAHTSEAFDRECIFTDKRNRTVWISNPEMLSLLLPKSKVPPPEEEARGIKRNQLEELRWALLRKLRCPLPEPAYPVTPRSPSFDIDDIRTLPFSDLDIFARSRHGRFIAGLYRRAVTRVFLAQRVALGFVEVVDGIDLLLRILICFLGLRMLLLWEMEAQQRGVRLLGLCSAVCGFHIYGLMKGYR